MGICLEVSPSAGPASCVSATDASAEADVAKGGKKGYFLAIAIEIVLLYFLNNLLHNYMANIPDYVKVTYPAFLVNIIDWLAGLHIPHLTDKYTSCLWAINTVLTVAILGNLILALNHPRWLHRLVKALIYLVAIMPVVVVWRVFPFSSLTAAQANALRIVFVVIAVALLLVSFIHLFQFIPAWREKVRCDRDVRSERERQRLVAAQAAVAGAPAGTTTTVPPEAPAVGQSEGTITNNEDTNSK